MRARQGGPASKSPSGVCFVLDFGWAKLTIYVFKGRFGLEDLKSLAPGRVKVGYSGEEDPGPCRVALAYLYRSEDEGPLGPPRIRNPALHIKAYSLGARQISELKLSDEFDVVYSIVDGESSECKPLKCSGDDLHTVSSFRAKSLK